MSDEVSTEKQGPTPMFSNAMYDRLKWVAQIGLPALGALYFGLSQIWGLPNGEQVVGTITVVDVFLGAILGLSARSYNESEAKYDGTMVAKPGEGDKIVYTFDVGNTAVEDLRTKQELVFKVEDLTYVPTQHSR